MSVDNKETITIDMDEYINLIEARCTGRHFIDTLFEYSETRTSGKGLYFREVEDIVRAFYPKMYKKVEQEKRDV